MAVVRGIFMNKQFNLSTPTNGKLSIYAGLFKKPVNVKADVNIETGKVELFIDPEDLEKLKD